MPESDPDYRTTAELLPGMRVQAPVLGSTAALTVESVDPWPVYPPELSVTFCGHPEPFPAAADRRWRLVTPALEEHWGNRHARYTPADHTGSPPTIENGAARVRVAWQDGILHVDVDTSAVPAGRLGPAYAGLRITLDGRPVEVQQPADAGER
jgi:hypothetical protein